MAEKTKKPAKEVTITGFIEEIEREDGEMVLQLNDGDHDYLIVMDKIGGKLQRYVDEEVDVTGVVTKSRNQREIKVNTFRLTDDYDDDDSYADDDDFSDDDDSYYDDGDDEEDDRRSA